MTELPCEIWCYADDQQKHKVATFMMQTDAQKYKKTVNETELNPSIKYKIVEPGEFKKCLDT